MNKHYIALNDWIQKVKITQVKLLASSVYHPGQQFNTHYFSCKEELTHVI